MKTIYWALIIFFLLPLTVYADFFRLARVEAPPHSRFHTKNDVEIASKRILGSYFLYLPKSLSYPFTLKIKGPLGGFVLYDIKSPEDLNQVNPGEDIILDKNSRPPTLTTLPLVCPRVNLTTLTYNAGEDILNHVPAVQLADRDALEGDQYKTGSEMDGENVLLVKKVKVSYDYEDSKIVDSIGNHHKTGKTQVINEGEGGFYANIHYAVIPYNKNVLSYDKQLLMHMAQGTLSDINKTEYRPSLRTHSFIPGPFLSKNTSFYTMCEWGDTAYQAPMQELRYEKMALWDWDYSVKDAHHVLLIVWEGDEEDWLIKQELIDPFFITDDVIGIFEIKKEDTENELTLVNKRGDFEITLQTGNF